MALDEALQVQTNQSMSNSANPEEYHLVVLGSGEAGKYLAWTLAREGKRAAVVKRRVRRRLMSQHRLSSQ